MAESTLDSRGQSAAAAVDPQLLQFVRERDVECPGCGYNVRNLASDRCPECGEQLNSDYNSLSRGRPPRSPASSDSPRA